MLGATIGRSNQYVDLQCNIIVHPIHYIYTISTHTYLYCLTCLQTHREHHYSGILVDFAIQLMTLLENINQDSFQRFRLRAGLNKVIMVSIL